MRFLSDKRPKVQQESQALSPAVAGILKPRDWYGINRRFASSIVLDCLNRCICLAQLSPLVEYEQDGWWKGQIFGASTGEFRPEITR